MGQSYNDSFSSFSSGGSSDSGGIFSGKDTRQNSMNQGGMDDRDVVLTPTPTGERNNSKKWMVILLVALVVVTAGLGIAWMVIGQNSGSPASNNVDLEKAFSNYACYLLNGDVCDKFNGLEVADFEDSFFVKSLDDGSFSEGYSSKLKEYYDTFNGKYSENSETDVDGLFYSNKVALYLVVYYYNGENLTMTGILEKYLSDGEDAAKTMIASKTAPFESLGVFYGVNFYETYYKWGMGTLELLKDYERIGCINDGRVDYGCVGQKKDSAIDDKNKMLSKQYMNMNVILGYCVNALYNNIVNFEEAVEYLNNGEEDEE